MACVTYDVTCKDCGYWSIDRYRPHNCEKCESENLNVVKEFDEYHDEE